LNSTLRRTFRRLERRRPLVGPAAGLPLSVAPVRRLAWRMVPARARPGNATSGRGAPGSPCPPRHRHAAV